MTTDIPLMLERDGAVATICFNRPSALNAIDPPMARAFLSVVRELVVDKSVRAVIMRGSGNGFMAGGDLAVLSADPQGGAAELIVPLHEAVRLLETMDAPLLAQVHGVAAGAGLSLMLQADFVLAAVGTRFNLAYANIGASCDVGASWALPRRVGLRRALEIALLSDTHDADAAERMGLINRVVPAAELEAEALALAHRLAGGPTQALGHLRRLMRSSYHRDLAGQLDAESAAFQACAATSDFRIGVDAFRSRKTPSFTGR
ncbi:2-(1,2-epoxy-1,2-dihydrophenyl)acetyl-CoA isomerase [Variovorax boronicumulans]|uniref:enoyl-CoA hydratase/isomerase family protein n=1 Tax=Variovorax boronicumulans TaxID=436515 RepID=UPI002475646F|nr:enoyl-CoA hydratase-related protein [Variovorax boronicumulans]MDH6164961.1 2-(1,2-epoxy-1,2-dihydrophenyl)acetyl-CoA isomerase [Variovorax boronicumulans]